MLFEFIVETPKEKGKRKKQKSPESDEGTHLVAEPFCFVKPISYYQDRLKRHDETVVKQPRPQGNQEKRVSCRHIATREDLGDEAIQ